MCSSDLVVFLPLCRIAKPIFLFIPANKPAVIMLLQFIQQRHRPLRIGQLSQIIPQKQKAPDALGKAVRYTFLQRCCIAMDVGKHCQYISNSYQGNLNFYRHKIPYTLNLETAQPDFILFQAERTVLIRCNPFIFPKFSYKVTKIIKSNRKCDIRNRRF